MWSKLKEKVYYTLMHPKRRVRKFNCKKCGEFEVVTGMYGGGDTGCGGCKCGNSKVFIN